MKSNSITSANISTATWKMIPIHIEWVNLDNSHLAIVHKAPIIRWSVCANMFVILINSQSVCRIILRSYTQLSAFCVVLLKFVRRSVDSVEIYSSASTRHTFAEGKIRNSLNFLSHLTREFLFAVEANENGNALF